jgi:hypothetical protein
MPPAFDITNNAFKKPFVAASQNAIKGKTLKTLRSDVARCLPLLTTEQLSWLFPGGKKSGAVYMQKLAAPSRMVVYGVEAAVLTQCAANEATAHAAAAAAASSPSPPSSSSSSAPLTSDDFIDQLDRVVDGRLAPLPPIAFTGSATSTIV